MSSELPRRTLLAGGGAVVAAALVALTGCTGSGSAEEEAERAERAPEALRLRQTMERDSTGLLAHYEAALTAHPGLTDAVRPLQEAVRAHVAALREELAELTGANEGAEGGDGDAATEHAGPKAPAIADDPQHAVADLADAEARLSEARLGALGEAPPELARLLASLAAAGGAQEYLLREAA